MAWMMEFWGSVFIVESDFLTAVENSLESVWALHGEIKEARANHSGHLVAIWVLCPAFTAHVSIFCARLFGSVRHCQK